MIAFQVVNSHMACQTQNIPASLVVLLGVVLWTMVGAKKEWDLS